MGQEKGKTGQKARRPGRPRTATEIELTIKKLAVMGRKAPEIYRLLPFAFPRKDFPNIRLPSLKTVRRIAEPYKPGGYWSLADADPDDAALLLPVVAEIAGAGAVFEVVAKGFEVVAKGKVDDDTDAVVALVPKDAIRHIEFPTPLPLPQELADWIVRVCRAAPGIPPLWALHVAQAYARKTKEGVRTLGLDVLLGFRPWESVRHRRRYLQTIARVRPQYFKEGLFRELLVARGNTVRLYTDDPVGYVTGILMPLFNEVVSDPIACGLDILANKVDSEIWPKGESDAKG